MDIQTAIAQTMQANPTATLIPSITPTPIPTPTPTPTLSPTLTPTETIKPTKTPTKTRTPYPTPTKTNSPTPLPPATQTALAIAATRTQNILNINATRTQAMVDAYATQTSRAHNITATAVAKSHWATQIAPYVKIDIRELINYPDKHIGEKVYVSGSVFNIAGNYEFQMWAGYSLDAIYVETKAPLSGLYEDDWVTVYGTVGGQKCFQNSYGAQICQPLLKDAFYTK